MAEAAALNPAPAPAGAPREGQNLDELMLAMDVVDTLRHQDLLVSRELDEERRDAELLERLRRIYKGQGIEVPDEVLREGVRALNESRFVYTPPPPGLARTLATLWVERGRYGRGLLGLLLLIGFGWAAYHFGVARPAQQRAEHARIEAQQRADEARAQAERARREITELLPRALEQGHREVVDEARVNEARERADRILADGRAALSRNDAAGARQAIGELEALRNALHQEYVLRIVSRPREPTAVWRVPARNPNARNCYLIVEAVAPDGHLVKVPVTSEEDGRTDTVSRWGVRVSEAVFEEVRRDKNDDGIVQRSILGEKRRGQLAPDYRMPVMGGAILTW
ncbi:MAG TPA: DUF6384 family protein [Beijerinckiaceae bacterium]|nr:DUF6384 family protein [Beijerinckiaceae bacterium]